MRWGEEKNRRRYHMDSAADRHARWRAALNGWLCVDRGADRFEVWLPASDASRQELVELVELETAQHDRLRFELLVLRHTQVLRLMYVPRDAAFADSLIKQWLGCDVSDW